MNSNSVYTENWVTVKEINNNIIYLDNKQMVTGVKIQPRNIFILEENYQNQIIDSLKTFYNLIDYEFWLIVADRPVDVGLYISQLQLKLNDTSSPVYRKLLLDDIAKAEMFMNNGVVDTEYFILFKEKDNDMMQKKVRNLINNLASCGLIASQTSNEDLRMILDNFLNGGVNFRSGVVIPNAD
ncbi:MAG: hypothetical protein J6B64_01320 [Bacilli bacterium]|nr:hypothetical protein [Bacilli bacterium]MBP3635136.1 hypothetical protein [Bacilli bacterium]